METAFAICLLIFMTAMVVYFASLVNTGMLHPCLRNSDIFNLHEGDLFIVRDGVLTTMNCSQVPDGYTLRKDSTSRNGWKWAP